MLQNPKAIRSRVCHTRKQQHVFIIAPKS